MFSYHWHCLFLLCLKDIHKWTKNYSMFISELRIIHTGIEQWRRRTRLSMCCATASDTLQQSPCSGCYSEVPAIKTCHQRGNWRPSTSALECWANRWNAWAARIGSTTTARFGLHTSINAISGALHNFCLFLNASSGPWCCFIIYPRFRLYDE